MSSPSAETKLGWCLKKPLVRAWPKHLLLPLLILPVRRLPLSPKVWTISSSLIPKCVTAANGRDLLVCVLFLLRVHVLFLRKGPIFNCFGERVNTNWVWIGTKTRCFPMQHQFCASAWQEKVLCSQAWTKFLEKFGNTWCFQVLANLHEHLNSWKNWLKCSGFSVVSRAYS